MLDMKLYGGHGTKLSVREIQLASLEILKCIDAVCKQEGLHYWLMFGSLIGAVRHKGFIPWDDDLDIAMPIDDYHRLMTYFVDHAEDFAPLVLIKPTLGLNRPFLITRVSDTRYKQIGEFGDLIPEMGTFVDVYPLDGLGSDIETALAHKERAYNLVLLYLRANNFKYYNKSAGIGKRLFKKCIAVALGSPMKYQRRLFDLCERYTYNSSAFVSNVRWTSTPDKSIYRKQWFEETRFLLFEGLEMPVPIGFDALLRNDYGDYMQLPSKENRVGHHFYSILQR